MLPISKSIAIMNQNFHNLIEEYKIESTRPEFENGLNKGHHVCDYIFVSDEIKVKSFEVLNTDVSDHLPLVLDFDIK